VTQFTLSFISQGETGKGTGGCEASSDSEWIWTTKPTQRE